MIWMSRRHFQIFAFKMINLKSVIILNPYNPNNRSDLKTVNFIVALTLILVQLFIESPGSVSTFIP